MSAPGEPLPKSEIRPVRGGDLVRTLNRFLPLGRKYDPLLGLLNGRHGLLTVPFGKYEVLQPAAWGKTIATQLTIGTDVVAEFQVLQPLVAQCRSGHLIDVGANIGLFTLSLRAASSLPIIAYEPQPFLFKLLEWNVAYNRLPAIEPRNLACGASRGTVAFATGLNGSVIAEPSAKTVTPPSLVVPTALGWEAEARQAQAGGIAQVPVTTLDEDLAAVEKIAVLKIDCEGFEFQILQGARETLRRHRPILFVEVHPEQLVQYGRSTRELLELIAPDYDLEFWYFQIGRHASKLGRSLEKFRRPRARRCPTVAEMLAASTRVPGPAQIFFVGRPKPPA